jgi:hypothetical protein
MNWQSIANGIVQGLTIAIVWACLLWGWRRAKARKIRAEVRKSLSTKKAMYWQAPDLFGIALKNSSAWPVIVRRTGFILATGSVALGYLGRKKPEYENHVLLKPDTDDCWGCPIDALTAKIAGVWIEYEYDTLLGRSKVDWIELVGEDARFFEDFRVAMGGKPTSD